MKQAVEWEIWRDSYVILVCLWYTCCIEGRFFSWKIIPHRLVHLGNSWKRFRGRLRDSEQLWRQRATVLGRQLGKTWDADVGKWLESGDCYWAPFYLCKWITMAGTLSLLSCLIAYDSGSPLIFWIQALVGISSALQVTKGKWWVFVFFFNWNL